MRTTLERQLRHMLLAYERLDAAWRMRLDLNANEKLVIMHLAEGVAAPGALARDVGITSAGMTNLLDRLEQRGLITRDPHPTDGRRVLVSLTKAAVAARLEFEQSAARMVDAVSAEDAPAVGRFLEHAVEVASEHARSAAAAAAANATDDDSPVTAGGG